MMLTTKGRYAVMAVLDIAVNSEDKPVSIHDISSRQNIAQNYLEQIFIKLKSRDIVSSTRGSKGGYVLSRDPSQIMISQIIESVGESIKITKCSDNLGCQKENVKCSTHDLWFGLASSIKGYLSSISVGDVISGNLNDNIL
jgi:Rrf2 family transcriptional regulator, iron-sulfur cluster assembly transcription factor